MFRIFSHSTPVHFSWNCESGPKLRKSFIYHLRILGVQHLKLIWNAKHGKPAWWRNSNGNRFVWWAFCAPWTWKQTECFPLTFLGQHIMLLAKLAGESQRHWADSLPLICNPEKNIAVCFAVQHLALIWTNQNTNHGVKQNDQCALCPCQELTIRIEGKHMGPGADLQKAGKRPCEAFYHPKQMSHGMLQSSKFLRGDMRGKLAPISSYPALIRCRSVACFRHPNFSIHYIPSGIPVLCWTYANEVSPKLQKSFIYQLCMAWCPTSKTDLILECQTCQTCLMKEFERKPLCVLGILRPMNMETNWMFPTDISWPTHHAIGEACSHLKLPGTDSLPLSGMLPTPQLFNTLLHTFRHPCIVLNSCQWCLGDRLFNVSHLFTFNSCPLLLKLREWPETAKVIHLSFVICLGVQHLKMIWRWNAKPGKPASWRNSNGNRFVWWAFCAPWTWKQTECFPMTFLGQHIMLLAKLAGESQRHWADSLPLICNPEKNIAVCFAVQHLALMWTNQNTNHGVKQNDQCALCPCQELTIRIEGKHMGPGADLQKAGKRPCEAFYHPKQMSHGMLQSSKFLRGDMRGKLAPISSYPALIRCRSVACFRHPNFSIHYIPSGIPALCWTHANGA